MGGECLGRMSGGMSWANCPGKWLEKTSSSTFRLQVSSVHAAVITCDALVNTQTDRQLLTGYTISSASRAKQEDYQSILTSRTGNYLSLIIVINHIISKHCNTGGTHRNFNTTCLNKQV